MKIHRIVHTATVFRRLGIYFLMVCMIFLPVFLQAQWPISASPDATICAPASITLTAAVNPQTRTTTSYLISPIPYNPDPFTLGTPVYLSDDEYSGVINIGFDFCFYGVSYNQLLISSNNYVSFDLSNSLGPSPWSIPGPVPSIANPTNTVMGPWQDINPGIGGQIYYNVAGTAPFRRFVVSYLNVPMFSCTGSLYSSQIILYETTNVVETHILNKPLCTTWNNGRAIHALHEQSGMIADVVTGRNSPAQWVTSNEGMRFIPNGVPAYTINWLVNNIQVGTGTSITVSPTSTTTYVAQVVYACTNASFTDTVVVNAAVNGPTPITGVVNVCPNDTASYSVPYSPTATYTWTVSNGAIQSGQGSNQILAAWTTLSPATVQVQISDNGCNSTGNLNITLGQVVNVGFSGLSPSYCAAFQMSNLLGNPLGGTFSGPGITGNNFNPLSAGPGTHRVIYTANLPGNCSSPDTQFVTVIPPLNGNAVGSSQTLCAPSIPQSLTGSIPSGGTGNYTYLWQSNSGSGWMNVSGGVNGNLLPSGNISAQYRRVLSGASPCPALTSAAVNISIEQRPGNNIIGSSQTLCSGQLPTVLTGTAPTGGTGTYLYVWQSSPDNVSWSAAGGVNSFASYVPGQTLNSTYFRRIVSSGICTSDTSNVISLTIYLQTTMTLTSDTICEGQVATISASATPSGGVYTWNTTPAQTGASITVSPIVSTFYQVQYVVAGCNILDSVKVIVYPLPAPQIQISGNLTFCAGDSVVLSAQPAGGNYLWSDGSVGQSITVLQSGTYTVQITDTNGCPASSQPVVTTLINSPIIGLNPTIPTCAGYCDGSILSSVVSGLPPYTYVWSTNPVQTGITASGLCAGTYSLTVQDAAYCQSVMSIVLTEPAALSLSNTALATSCFGFSDGSIQLSANGGTAPYLFSISNNPLGTTQNYSGLSAGTYSVQVRDSKMCTIQSQVIITQPADLQVQISYTSPLCFGDANGTATAIVQGGTGPYNFTWSNMQTQVTAMYLYTGSYSVQVTDAHFCQAVSSVMIPEPELLTVSTSGFDLTCASPPDNGTAIATASGGTMPYYYDWTVGAAPDSAYNTGMPAGTWTVRLTDANSCSAQASIVLRAPVLPIAYTAQDTFMCSGSGGVPLHGWGTGGELPYTYVWTQNNGSLSNSFSDSPNANPDTTTTYYFQVIDDAGCASALVSQKVTVHALPVADAGPDLTYCENGPAVFLNGSVVSPPGSYSVQWNPSNQVYCDTCLTTYAIPASSQIYTLVVRNRITGCTSDSTTLNTLSSVVVSVKPRPVADAGPDTLICQGGSAQFCGTAGNAGPGYSWYWQPAIHISDTSEQCPTVTPPSTFTWYLVTESDGCFSQADSVTVFVSALPVVDAGTVLNICAGDSVQLQGLVQSGIAQQYSWTPVQGLSDPGVLQPMASPAVSGWYYLQANHQGCLGEMDSVEVIVHAVPVADAGRDTAVCGGGMPVTLLGNVYYTGYQPLYASWEPGQMQVLQPVVTPLASQEYVLQIRSGVAPTECVSYDTVFISILPEVQLELSGDTGVICAGQSVHIQAEAGVGSAGFSWSPDPGNAQQGTGDVIVYPVENTIYQIIAEESGCRDTAYYEVKVHPIVEAYFNPSQLWGCAPFALQFQNLSRGALSYQWDFGDGSAFSNESEPRHVYDTAGVYYLSMIAAGVGGCKDTMVFNLPVRTGDSIPVQGFIEPEAPIELTLPMATIHLFTNNLDPDITCTWFPDEGVYRIGDEIFYTYSDTGVYFIRLLATHSAGCRREQILGPVIVKAPEVQIPNVFTPNGDGSFDQFKIEYSGDEAFYLVIMDRWGVTCFETHNKNQSWDGKDLNGQDLPEGVYFYSVEMGRYRDNGSITLLR